VRVPAVKVPAVTTTRFVASMPRAKRATTDVAETHTELSAAVAPARATSDMSRLGESPMLVMVMSVLSAGGRLFLAPETALVAWRS